MLIGEDFEKIAWQPLGLDFVEPNALYGDILIFIFAMVFARGTKKLGRTEAFFSNWRYFFIVFGVSFLLGGLGHFCFNYFGVPGKYPSWYLGIIATYFVEQAMFSLFTPTVWSKRLLMISKVKVALALVASTLVFALVDLNVDPGKGLLVNTINTTIGLLFALGYLGVRYTKRIDSSFKYFWISVLVLLPTGVIQAMKINLHPWFDRNDFSHVLLIVGLILYYAGVRGYNRFLTSNR